MTEINLQNSQPPEEFTTANEMASIIIVTFNHRKYLDNCIASITKQNYPHEIILVDNGSTDGTISYVKGFFPEITIIESKENKGYGAGNNLGFTYAKGKYIVILNPDVIVENFWLERLISPLKNQEHIITTPKILIFDGSTINTIGNSNHFTGLTFTRGLGADPSEYNQTFRTTGVSGACFALTRDAYRDIGGFDEAFFLYNEDSDFSWRANIRGYEIFGIPDSIIFHDYRLKVHLEKIYFLEKGRYIILRKYFTMRDLIILSPSLLIAELLTFGYASKFGTDGIRFKLKAIIEGICMEVKNSRKNQIDFSFLDKTIPVDQLTFTKTDKIVKTLANKIFAWNIRVLK
jgi:GT2 family glycosyltransferase